MQQLASSTRSDACDERHAPPAAGSAEDWIALEQRCERLEQMIGELLLRNHELRMQLQSQENRDESAPAKSDLTNKTMQNERYEF